MTDGLRGIEQKSDNDIRFVTFNVNGIRTLFHYQPFSTMNQSLRKVFDYLQSDVITFQELKTERLSISRWGKVDGFYSFISIPTTKKGYSGVGCWIRIPPVGNPLHHQLKVIKAEEGITGCLTIKIRGNNVRYRDDLSQGIGGYDSLGLDEKDNNAEALKLDSEGRCVIVELACNIIIFNVYCPANSTFTQEGQEFKMKFLKVLFKRIRNLKEMKKNVILMGDLNVCRDLIDSAEALENSSIQITSETTGCGIEANYSEIAREFVLNPDTPHRRLLNQIITDSIIPEVSDEGILIDTTRFIQTKKRLKMYTVWNTLKNTRSINYGSRIDFILISNILKEGIKNANILPDVMGSDHCPVYFDLNMIPLNPVNSLHNAKLPKFEAKFKFELNHRNVLDLFSENSNKAKEMITELKDFGSNTGKSSINETNDLNRIVKRSISNKSKSIDSFFKSQHNGSVASRNRSMELLARISGRNEERTSNNIISTQSKLTIAEGLDDTPLCKHNEEAILRISKTVSNFGKRFWTCKKPKGDSNNRDSSCGFFQWI